MSPRRFLFALLFAVLAAPTALATDLSITAANVKTVDNESTVQKIRFGESITQGQALYRSSADGKYYKADADHLTAGNAAAVCIALTPGSTDEYGFAVFEGLMNVGATLTVGEIYCLSDAPGGIRPEADNGSTDRITILGVATTSSVLWVKPFASGAAVP
jgi:hypothetical protein